MSGWGQCRLVSDPNPPFYLRAFFVLLFSCRSVTLFKLEKSAAPERRWIADKGLTRTKDVPPCPS
jgi:hypothetical protein